MRRTPRGIYLTDRLWVGREPKAPYRLMRGYAWVSVCLLGLRVDLRIRH